MNELEKLLSDFDPIKRKNALIKLISDTDISKIPTQNNVNMHFHSFFSFNS